MSCILRFEPFLPNTLSCSNPPTSVKLSTPFDLCPVYAMQECKILPLVVGHLDRKQSLCLASNLARVIRQSSKRVGFPGDSK